MHALAKVLDLRVLVLTCVSWRVVAYSKYQPTNHKACHTHFSNEKSSSIGRCAHYINPRKAPVVLTCSATLLSCTPRKQVAIIVEFVEGLLTVGLCMARVDDRLRFTRSMSFAMVFVSDY
jgi:hypothetical protein